MKLRLSHTAVAVSLSSRFFVFIFSDISHHFILYNIMLYKKISKRVWHHRAPLVIIHLRDLAHQRQLEPTSANRFPPAKAMWWNICKMKGNRGASADWPVPNGRFLWRVRNDVRWATLVSLKCRLCCPT